MAGWGGMMTLDTGDDAAANRLMTLMPRHKVGYLAVSLAYFKTVFTTPAPVPLPRSPPNNARQQACMKD